MDKQLFIQACECVIDQVKVEQGVGTLQEKTIHAVLKHYFSPDTSAHERKVAGFVADIKRENEIIEIQTKGFHLLRRKLDAFLPEHKVMVVYPVCHRKWLRWVNEETGEISAPRKSPKVGTAHEVFPELYRIKTYLSDPNFSLCIILLDIEEFRLLNGWSSDKKKGSSRNDGIPVDLFDEIILKTPEDYGKLIPVDLQEPFTTKDFKKETKLPARLVGVELNILHYLNTVRRTGKQGNNFLYERNLKETKI